MSSSTGIRKESSENNRVIRGLIENDKAFVESLKPVIAASALSGTGGGGGDSGTGSGGSASGNFLPLSGGAMRGPLANESAILTISSDAIDVSSTSGNDASYVILNPEGGTADNLVTITPGSDVLPNRELWLEIFNQTITLKNTGNIITPSGDFAAPAGTVLKLVYVTTLTSWVIVASSSGIGGGSGSLPINVNVTNVPSPVNPVTLNLNDSDGHVWRYELTQDLTIGSVTNIPPNLTQRTFEIEIVNDDAPNSWDVFLPSNFIDELGNQISSFTVEAGKFVLLSCRVNNGNDILIQKRNVTATVGSVETFTWSNDHSANTFDLNTLDRLLFDQAAGSSLTITQSGITSNAAGDMLFNTKGLLAQYNFGMNADGSPRLQINNTTVVSQSLLPVDPTVVTGDTLGASGSEWARLSVTDVVLKSGDDTSKVIFDGDASTPKTYFTGSATTGRVNFYSEIASVATNVAAFTNSNIELFGNTDLILTTGQIRAGGATKGMENTGHIDFVDNTATPAATLSIYSDGTDLLANSGGLVRNLSDIVAGGAAHTIQDEGTSLTQRTNLDFIGAGVTVTDDAGGNKTKVTITSGTVPDADYGDITVSGSGTVWAIDNGAVTGTKIANTTIVNSNISASAAIQKSKISTSGTWAISDIPTNFAREDVVGTFSAQKTFSQQTLFDALINLNDNEVDNVKQVGIRENFVTGTKPASQTNEGIFFAVPTAGGKTEIRCAFQTGGSVLIAVEP